MATLVYGMNMSLDGFVDHDRFAPDPTLFNSFVDQVRHTAGAIYGRGLYELMHYWDGDAWAQGGADRGDLRGFAEGWRAMPKWVVSRSLTAVGPNATLLTGDVEAQIRRIKAERTGEIEVGGPKLAAFLAERGLIDQYRVFLHPVVLGHGRPFFDGFQPSLRLISSERIGADAVKLMYVPTGGSSTHV